jgi:hypothetical protein
MEECFPQACNDLDPCTGNSCLSPGAGCSFWDWPEGTPCNDGLLCTVDPTCNADGKCVGELSPDLDGDSYCDLIDPDDDDDGLLDEEDNCPVNPNPDQADEDQDGTGDACEKP